MLVFVCIHFVLLVAWWQFETNDDLCNSERLAKNTWLTSTDHYKFSCHSYCLELLYWQREVLWMQSCFSCSNFSSKKQTLCDCYILHKDRMADTCALELQAHNVTSISLWHEIVKTELVLACREPMAWKQTSENAETYEHGANKTALNAIESAEFTEFAGKCIVALVKTTPVRVQHIAANLIFLMGSDWMIFHPMSGVHSFFQIPSLLKGATRLWQPRLCGRNPICAILTACNGKSETSECGCQNVVNSLLCVRILN